MADNNGGLKRNPNNSEHILYKTLTRLFSGPITSYRAQSQLRYKRRDLDKLASKFTSASGNEFKRKVSNPYESMHLNYIANQNRAERYVDFDQMMFSPIIAGALSIYADEMTTKNRQGKILNIYCKNEEIKSVLETLFFKILNVEFNAYNWAKTMLKYGDMFLYMDMDEKFGIKNVICLPSQEVERLEGKDKTNPNYVQYQWNSAGMTFEQWQIAHFRNLGDDKYSPYGLSIFDASRRIWRQLTLLEDHMMAYRIVRSSERRVYYVDVGNIKPEDVEQHMQKVMTSLKRNQIVDSTTGRVDLRYNPVSLEEDIYLPIRGDLNKTKIETLSGGKYVGDIDDVKYLRDQLYTSLLIPQSYLTSQEGSEDKQTLSMKDIRFARTIERLQRAFVSELEKMAIAHLFILGFRNDDLLSFKLSLNTPSKLADLQDLELLKTQIDAANSAKDSGFFSTRWIYENVFKMSPEELLRNDREKFYDKALQDQMESDPMEGGMDLGGGDLSDLPDDNGILAAPDEAAETTSSEPEEPENPLLSMPAKRDDSSYTTPGAKGKMYKPVASDKRGAGARTRNYKAQWSDETSSSTTRNLFKGSQEKTRLGRGIMSEQKDLKIINDTEQILEQLEKKFTKVKESK